MDNYSELHSNEVSQRCDNAFPHAAASCCIREDWYIEFDAMGLAIYIDLAAQKLLEAEKDGKRIAVVSCCDRFAEGRHIARSQTDD